MKLSLDDRDILFNVLDGDSWDALKRLLEALAKKQEERVFKYDLSKGAEQLAYEKARVEGAYALARAINEYRTQLIKEQARA